ncbi:MAG: hypothetical protein PWR24_298 [Desulfonauticus sp.]|jgi:hypothetical protein|nr:hypothetical protein [Desulfonauticus sp.]
MKQKWLIIMAALFLVACAQKKQVVKPVLIFNPQNQLTTEVKTIKVKVKLSSDEYKEKGKSAFWNAALKEAMQQINREILKMSMIVRPSARGIKSAQFLVNKGEINPKQNPYTKDLEQEFEVTLTLTPSYAVAGKVISLKQNTYAIGTHDFCYIAVFEDYNPGEVENRYFAIGKFSKEEGIIRLTGMGKITQALTEDKFTKGYGLLAQGEIYEVKEEVEVDDIIFLPKVEVKAISQPLAASENSLKPEVVVEPRYLEELKVPAEAK